MRSAALHRILGVPLDASVILATLHAQQQLVLRLTSIADSCYKQMSAAAMPEQERREGDERKKEIGPKPIASGEG